MFMTQRLLQQLVGVPLLLALSACGDDAATKPGGSTGGNGGQGGAAGAAGADGGTGGSAIDGGDSGLTPVFADVLTVGFGGGNLNYQVTVTISSPDTSCEQYADWWEVLTPDGQLIFRQTFDGPHLDKQPFAATAQAVPIESNVAYIYRVHVFPHGYGGAFKFQDQTGKVSSDTTDYASSFPELADADPQPPACTQ